MWVQQRSCCLDRTQCAGKSRLVSRPLGLLVGGVLRQCPV
nr:MAG TPA: hypothetical protein [Caudoviricetes sp.]